MTTALSGKPTFGASRAFVTGNYAYPTPARLPVPQSQSIDFKRKLESLYGENQLAVAVGAGSMDVTGKVEYGKTQARVIADIMFGDPGSTGSYLEADGEAGTPTGTPPIYTAANAAEFLFDLGVIDVTTGNVMTCVSASPVLAKSYMVSAEGVYTFATSDTGNKKVSYAYSSTSSGETVPLNNQPQGLTGSFQATHVLPWGAEQDMYVFYSCLASSSGLSAKQSGFGSSTLEYTASVNGNGQLGVASFAEEA